MEKIKTISRQGGSIHIETVVTTPKRTKRLTGRPAIVFYPSHVQLGCIRMTYEALRILQWAADNLSHAGHVMQTGTYDTNDPMSRTT